MDFEEKLEKARSQNEYLKGTHAASDYAQWLYRTKDKIRDYRREVRNGKFYTVFSSGLAAFGNLLYWLGARAVYLKEPPKGTTVAQLDIVYPLFFSLPVAYYFVSRHFAKNTEKELKEELGEGNFEPKLKQIEEVETPMVYGTEDEERAGKQKPESHDDVLETIRKSHFKPSPRE